MKKITIILIILTVFIAGCEFRYDIPYDYDYQHVEKMLVESADIFSIGGKLYLSVLVMPPFSIYNPNQYEITVYIDGVDQLISGHGTLHIDTPAKGGSL